MRQGEQLSMSNGLKSKNGWIYTLAQKVLRDLVPSAFLRTVVVPMIFVVGIVPIQNYAQSLSIVDAVPPYKLTPTLLSNGHFSISTNYTSQSKTLIYREDGSGGRPVNYTSHFHVKVDDVVFQLGYEPDTATRVAPPAHPIKVEQIYRDTLSGTPRIHADCYGVMPDGDTMRFVFSMFPVKKPSGGFIRLTVTVQNSNRRARSVGVLMLVDTKIGNNDRAPIATSFGYSSVEQEFRKGIGTGIPDFWLAMEGNPVAPGLVARGNLSDADLISPDLLIFGNWTDFTSQGIKGLASVLWKERSASLLQYTDSAVLLVWDEENLAPGSKKLKASTEIGIVDSLSVVYGGGSGGGGGGFGAGGFGIAGVGGCVSVETNHENPCGVAGYSPYLPDSVQALYLVSNLDSLRQFDNTRLRIESLPRGVSSAQMTIPVIPNSLSALQTGVVSLTLFSVPRLDATQYRIPVAVVVGANDSLVVHDTLDVCVPGLRATLEGIDARYAPVCPQSSDTLLVRFKLHGVRCLPTLSATLTGNAADVAQFSVVNPLPAFAQGDSIVTIKVHYAPTVNNNTPTIGVVLRLKDYESLAPNDTTFDFPSDTAFITAPSREAEFEFARPIDTLHFGHICVGDTATGDWDILNTGGCTVNILSCSTTALQGANEFAVLSSFGMSIPRSQRDTVQFRFTPSTPGKYLAFAIVQSPHAPRIDTLVLAGEADLPRLDAVTGVVDLDTVCSNTSVVKRLMLNNPTACPVVVDSVRLNSTQAGWSVLPQSRFVIPPNSSVAIQLSGNFTTSGQYSASVTAYSSVAGNMTRTAAATAVARSALATDSLGFGDVFLGQSVKQQAVIHSSGTAAVEMSNLRFGGLFPTEYTLRILYPSGATLPLMVNAGDSVVVEIEFSPKDIEQRSAELRVELKNGCSLTTPVRLFGRGVQPLIDVRSRILALGRVCAGQSIDTTIEIRNPGNAALSIDNVQITGGSDFSIEQNGPISIAPDSMYALRVRFVPTTIGDRQTTMSLSTNGRWITPTDTMLVLYATGIICGSISADTIDALIGEPLSIPLRFTPEKNSTLTALQLVQLMNSSVTTALSLGVGYNDELLRVRSFSNTEGMVSTQLPGILSTAKNSSTIRTTNSSLSESSIVAILNGDVLLGREYQTPLHLRLDTFANGYSRIRLVDGLVRAQYCAFDSRRINSSGVQLFLRVDESREGSIATIYTDTAHNVEIWLSDMQGIRLNTMFKGELSKGTHQLPFPANLSNGMYMLQMRTEETSLAEKCLIIR